MAGCHGHGLVCLHPYEPRIEIANIPDSRLVNRDIAPHWPLGRVAVEKGTDRLIAVTRTTERADLDDDGEPIEGTMRARKLERLWLAIPAGTPMGAAVKVESLERSGRTSYEVDNLDGRGWLKGPHVPSGFVTAISEQDDEVVVMIDVEVRPVRPFLAENWMVERRYTLPRSGTVEREEFNGLKKLEIREVPPP